MGLFKDIFKSARAEFGRMWTLGNAEIANGIFHGSNTFVLYGEGQKSPEMAETNQQPQMSDHSNDQEMEMGRE